MTATNNSHLIDFCLRIADNHLILGQRTAEWCGCAPYLEEDLAMSNIGLDILGRANYFYQYVVELDDNQRTVDDYALLRKEKEYKNDLIVELPNGDYASTILRLYLFTQFQQQLFSYLITCTNKSLNALAERAIKEMHYHIRHTKAWIIRFGNGTEESMSRLAKAIENVYKYTHDMFEQADEIITALEKIGVPPFEDMKEAYTKMIEKVFKKANMEIPKNNFRYKARQKGLHTEHMGHLLSEMQYMQRTFPNCKW